MALTGDTIHPERTGRVQEKGGQMKTRSSYQRGYVEQRQRKDSFVYLLRWRVRDPSAKNGWRFHSETLRDCPSKKAAFRELDRRMREVNIMNNGATRPIPTTFREFASGPWDHYVDNNEIKPSTRYGYDSMLRNHLLKEFGDLKMERITSVHLSQFFNKLRKKDLSPQYRKNIYALLRTMFEVAVQYELLAASPIRQKLHRPKASNEEKPMLTPEKIQQVLVKIPEYWRTLFILAAVTGLRAGELLGLRWKNVDWTSHKLHITHSLWRGQLVRPKTKASNRVLHIPDTLLNILLAHLEISIFTGPDDFVFCKADGDSCDPDYLRKKILYPAIDAVGIKRSPGAYGFHVFRHSAGSIVHKKTGSVKLAQNLLGHSRMDTTADIYVHVDEKAAEKAAEAVAEAIIPSCSLIAHSRSSGSDQVQ